MKKVIVLAGPTASGKTSLSIKIAQHFGLEIINGDSVAIFKDLDIGSAKIKDDEMEGVKHHLLSYVEPGNKYSVYNFQQDVRKVITDMDVAFIVGGSGFYIKSSLYDYEFREEQETELDLTLQAKVDYIKQHDPQLQIDFQNERRVDRAYKMTLNNQQPSKKRGKNVPLYQILLLYLDMPRNLQEDLMIKRVIKQIDDGFVQEVEGLRERNIFLNDTIGYREINQYLDHEISLQEAINKIVRVSFQFSKRQRTWFINQMSPVLLDPLSENLLEDSIKVIKEFLNS